jgi:hypothetical protein
MFSNAKNTTISGRTFDAKNTTISGGTFNVNVHNAASERQQSQSSDLALSQLHEQASFFD